MIRITHEQLLRASGALDRLVDVPLAAGTAARVARVARLVEPTARAVLERRDELVDRYAERDEDGRPVPATDERLRARGMVRIDRARRAEFELAVAELLAEEVELDAEPIRLRDLVRASGESLDLVPSILVDLGPLFEEGVPTADRDRR